MAELRIGSLCSGYGGLDMSVMDVLDASVAWHCQYDPDDRHQYAARILDARFPGVPNHGDITAIDWSSVEPVDILTAGFPCQPVSNAGKRKGHEDARWLWPHVEAAIRGVRPRLVFLENVSALANRGGDAVLGSLAALGFDAEWACLRASDVGAPHRRERWFCLAWHADDDLRDGSWGPVLTPESDPVGDAGGAPADPSRVGEREPADQADSFADGGDAREEPRRRGLRTAPDAASERHGHTGPQSVGGVPTALVAGDPVPHAESIGRGEGRPQPARLLGGSHAPERGRPAAADPDYAGARPQQDREPHRPEGLHEHGELDAPGRLLDWGAYGTAIERWEHVMARPAPSPTEPGKNGPRLAPRFVEWLMGCPDGWITDVPGIPRTAQLKAAGNGVVRQQGAAAFRYLLEARRG